MVTYPIYVERKSYRSSKELLQQKANEYNRVARELEEHINRQIREQAEEIKVYYYDEIARGTGYPIGLVREILFSVDGGYNGFTAKKPTDIDDIG